MNLEKENEQLRQKLAKAQALLRELEHRAVDVVEAIHGMELPGAIPVRVQKLHALLSGMPEHDADDWIKASERLPGVNDHVIVATEFFGPGDWRIKVGGLEEDGSWNVFGASWTPSHWKPLPAAPRHKASATAQPAERNQCDGCQAGIPLVDGVHRMGKPGGYPDAMSCQASKYANPTEGQTNE